MENLKIIDFILDEKFIDNVVLTDSLFKEENHEYILCSKNKPKEFRYIKNTQKISVLNPSEIKKVLIQAQYDAIFIHSLISLPLRLYKYIPKLIPIFWFSWGFDIYQYPSRNPLVPIKLLHHDTQEILNRIESKSVKKKIFKYLGLYKCKDLYTTYYIKRILKRINFHSGVLPYETTLINNFNPEFKALRVQYNYVDPYPEKRECIQCEGNDIIIGNSGAFTNNHVDILKYMKTLDIGKRKIIMPLSYGGNKEYCDIVINKYKNRYGEKFIPLTSFLPKSEYFTILKKCAIAIYYTERQQAIGNIWMALLSGQKVFLSETSEVFKYYKKIGFKIFSIQSDLILNNSLSPLCKEDRLWNHELCSKVDNWIVNRNDIRTKIINFQHYIR